MEEYLCGFGGFGERLRVYSEDRDKRGLRGICQMV